MMGTRSLEERYTQCAELVCGFVGGGAIESIIHRLVVQELVLPQDFDPTDEDTPESDRIKYHECFAWHQIKILAHALTML
jgi:hypothetical protein